MTKDAGKGPQPGVGIKPLGKTRLRSNLKRLCLLGIVEVGREGNGKTSRLVYSILDVQVEAVVEWVEGHND